MAIVREESNVVVVYPNFYVELVDNTTGEVKNIKTNKGGYNKTRPLEALCLDIVKKDPARLLHRFTTSDGVKLYDTSDEVAVDVSNFS